jgi:hypothetical protein
MLIIGFISMISLQVMNGYSSRKGASQKKVSKVEEEKKPELGKITIPVPEAPKVEPEPEKIKQTFPIPRNETFLS